MKKNLISLLTMVLAITVSIFSCTKQDAEKQLKDQSLLNEDETFIAKVNELMIISNTFPLVLELTP